jgi:hypothetical protein
MNIRATSRIVPFETGMRAPSWVGLAVGTISEPTDLTQHTSNRKGSAPR